MDARAAGTAGPGTVMGELEVKGAKTGVTIDESWIVEDAEDAVKE